MISKHPNWTLRRINPYEILRTLTILVLGTLSALFYTWLFFVSGIFPTDEFGVVLTLLGVFLAVWKLILKPYVFVSIRDLDDELAVVLDPRDGKPVWLESASFKVGTRLFDLSDELLPYQAFGGERFSPCERTFIEHQTIMTFSKAVLLERTRCPRCRRKERWTWVRIVVVDSHGDKSKRGTLVRL